MCENKPNLNLDTCWFCMYKKETKDCQKLLCCLEQVCFTEQVNFEQATATELFHHMILILYTNLELPSWYTVCQWCGIN